MARPSGPTAEDEADLNSPIVWGARQAINSTENERHDPSITLAFAIAWVLKTLITEVPGGWRNGIVILLWCLCDCGAMGHSLRFLTCFGELDMSGAIPVEAVIPLTGAVNAAILAVAISFRKSVGTAVLIYAAALLMIVATVIFVIVADHAGLAALSSAERLLTLAAGPVFLLFIAAAIRRSLDWRAVAMPALGVLLADFFLDVSFGTIVAVQSSYTGAALVWTLSHRSDGLRSSDQRKRFALLVIGMMLLVHAAQAVRFAAPHVTSLENLVPNVAGVGVLLLALFAFLRARLPLVDLLAPAQMEQRADVLSGIVDRLDHALFAGGLARNAELKVSDAAAAAGVSPRELARALAEVRGTSFSEHVVRTRVEIARALMCDPAERRTSMEAIGLLAGFGSRSAFYSAFTKHVGETPSAFRKRYAEDSCPDS